MIPVARTDNLVVQDFEDEIIVCEMGSNATHCLSPIATRIWKYCDGSNTLEDIAKFLEEDLDVSLDSGVDVRGLVWLMIDELQRNGLIKEYLKQPIIDSSISRRKMLKRLSIAGGFAAGAMFPAVRSMVIPEPAEASSPPPPPPPDDDCSWFDWLFGGCKGCLRRLCSESYDPNKVFGDDLKDAPMCCPENPTCRGQYCF